MKKSILLVAIAAVTLASCNKESSTNNGDSLTPISLTGSAASIDATRAVVNAGTAFDATVVGSLTQGDYTTLYQSGTPAADFNSTVSFTAAGVATYSPLQYYPTLATANVNMKGFAPVASTNVVRTNNVLVYTINGSQDVMISNEVSANKTAGVTAQNLTFAHKLTQLQFEVKGNDAVAVSAWGNVTSIEILDQPSVLTYNFATGAFTSSTTPVTFTAQPAATTTLALTPASAGTSMILPVAALSVGTPLKLLVKTVNNTVGQTINLDEVAGGTVLAASTAYKITLTFKATGIVLSGSVTAWVQNGTATNVDVQ